MIKKILICALTAVVTFSSFSGCSKGTSSATSTVAKPEPKVTMRFATQSMSDKMGKVTNQILNDFQKKHPNVTLAIEESPGNDLITKINTDIMAGNTPDVFTFWRPETGWNVPKYAEMGAIADLTGLMKSSAFQGVFPDYAIKTASQINGIVYCIPRTSYFIEFLVNKSIFDQNNLPLPNSWDNLVNDIKVLKSKGVIPWATSLAPGLDDSSRLFNAVLDRVVGNAKALDLLQGKASYKDPDVLQALQYLYQIMPNAAPQDASAINIQQVIEKYFNTGKSAMVLDNILTINQNLTPDIQKNLVALEFPLTPVSVEKAPSTESDVTNLLYASAKAYKDPNKKALIDELITDLCNKKAAKAYVENAQQIVPHLGVDIDKSLVPQLQIDAQNVVLKQPGDKWLLSFTAAATRDEFRIAINDFWGSKYTPEKFADKLESIFHAK